jgi:uncharacterized membrane protein
MEDVVVESYPLKSLIIANVVIIIWLMLGIYAIWLVIPLLAAVWAVYLAVMLLFVMRASICTKCRYYGGRCSTGWGWYTSKLFAKGNEEDFPRCFGARFAPFLWTGICLLPAAVIAISLIFEFTILKLILLAVLILIAYLFGNKKSRKKTCSECKMNDLCPMGVAMLSEGDGGNAG